MVSYEYARVKNYLTVILTKNELDAMLTSGSVESCIKTIVDKPIGLKLYEAIRKGVYDLTELYRVINVYNKSRIDSIRNLVKGRARLVVDAFNKLFDIVNIISAVIAVANKVRPATIYPVGETASIDFSEVDSLEALKEKIPPNLRFLIDDLLVEGSADFTGIYKLFGVSREHLSMDQLVRRVYGFLRDTLLIRTCTGLKHVPQSIPTLTTITRTGFVELCETKDIRDLPALIRGYSPMYSGFSELLNNVFKLNASLEAFDLAVMLYASHVAGDLIANVEQVVGKVYVLLTAEAFLVKIILTSIETGIGVDVLKNIVDKWWVL